MTGGSVQLRQFRRAVRDGRTVEEACTQSGITPGEAKLIVAEDAKFPPPPEAFELLGEKRPAVQVEHGDCLDVMERLAAEGVYVDLIATDPPYHLTSIVERFGSATAAPNIVGATGVYARSSAGFMGQEWDGGDIAFRVDTWSRAYRLLRPGGHLFAFGGTRTYHRMACAIEDAGFEIRDQIGWLYGTGFPKREGHLKPAWEPIVVARKPLLGTVEDNMAVFGVGALDTEAGRIFTEDQLRAGAGGIPCRHDPETPRKKYKVKRLAPGAQVNETGAWKQEGVTFEGEIKPGRWPANVAHDGSDEVLEAFAEYGQRGALAPVHKRSADKFRNTYGAFKGDTDEEGSTFRGDSGTAARFFYSAKAKMEDRAGSKHPTVKPVGLMQWLIRMGCPADGVVLDPFAGSGSTGAAAIAEGRQAILIEQSEQYARDICNRLGIEAGTVVKPRQPSMEGIGPLFD